MAAHANKLYVMGLIEKQSELLLPAAEPKDLSLLLSAMAGGNDELIREILLKRGVSLSEYVVLNPSRPSKTQRVPVWLAVMGVCVLELVQVLVFGRETPKEWAAVVL